MESKKAMKISEKRRGSYVNGGGGPEIDNAMPQPFPHYSCSSFQKILKRRPP